MRITLNKIGNARKEGKWNKIDIEFTRDGGKSSKRTLVAVGETKGVIEALREEGAVGSDFEIKVEKDGEFWNWVGATKVEGGGGGEAKQAYRAKSTYETPEERARKNVSIARQNALTNSVNWFSAKDGKATVDQVLAVATEFAAFTLGELDVTMSFEDNTNNAAKKADDDFEDDIPF